MSTPRFGPCGLLTAAALGACGSLSFPALGDAVPGRLSGNLLLNPTFRFHAFANHRSGQADNAASHNVAYWNTATWGEMQVMREAHAPAEIRPSMSVENLVRLEPGARFWQFMTLPEAGLAHGSAVSLAVFGHQEEPGALEATVTFLKLDSEDGEWTPADFGMADQRTFPRHARGELVAAGSESRSSSEIGRVELNISGALIPGRFHPAERDTSYSEDSNTIGLEVSFRNRSATTPVWLWWPSLSAGGTARSTLPPAREMYPWYRHIPRTMQKLWKGEAIHIILMGSSIDRGSANPPMYPYDEDPDSPTFKQPLADRVFAADKVGRPDLEGYIGWWQHYFNYAGRLRLELMRKFDLPVEKILLNVMACDGSCVGEAHSGLEAYCSLSLPPGENSNGHRSGDSWEALYPDVFSRPGGPRPDLVIFGSGANEKTDTPDEVAVFEGTMRWIQRHYPDTEFLFCMFQNAGAYTPNAGDLQALSLRYQVPYLDYGKLGDEVTRWCNRYALVPRDGHPQAAAHYLWFKQIEKAFECWDPLLPGQAQLQLPERLHANTYGWEGDMVSFAADSPRIRGNMMVLEDTAVNCWGGVDEEPPRPRIDGIAYASRRSSLSRDLRNSMFRFGSGTLGDRHILEIAGAGAVLTAVDAKVCPNRRFLPVDHALWELGGLTATAFQSAWGAPYGTAEVLVPEGAMIGIDVPATDLSIAYVDAAEGGTLVLTVDGSERLRCSTAQPFVDSAGTEHYLENRRGVRGLAYGMHRVQVHAREGAVRLLGLYTYDSRANRAAERSLQGIAAAGETVQISAPFRARPLVRCGSPLVVRPGDIHADRVTFGGSGAGWFEIIGE